MILFNEFKKNISKINQTILGCVSLILTILFFRITPIEREIFENANNSNNIKFALFIVITFYSIGMWSIFCSYIIKITYKNIKLKEIHKNHKIFIDCTTVVNGVIIATLIKTMWYIIPIINNNIFKFNIVLIIGMISNLILSQIINKIEIWIFEERYDIEYNRRLII